jgi:hypothetical protein
MGPKKETSIIDELVSALKDEKVLEAIGALIERKLQPFVAAISELKTNNEELNLKATKLESDLNMANRKIDSLEAYNRADNLIVVGMPVVDYAEATSATSSDLTSSSETSATTERAIIELCRDKLNVGITTSDISIAHRLKKSNSSSGPAPIIVKFSTRKARDAVFAARRRLKGSSTPIFINEDLTKVTADLFRRARLLFKNKRIYGTWTQKGSVYVKTSNDPGCRAIRIADIDQLTAL